MHKLAALMLTFLSASSAYAEEADKKVVEHLQDISVTIVSESNRSKGEGSGVIVTRKRGDEAINFVWTAAHVVDNLRTTRKVVDPKTGSERTLVEFKDAVIVKELVAEGRSVGKMELFAQVIRFSADEDLALLRIRKKNFISDSVTFYLEKDAGGSPVIPSINTDLYHVGSLLGQVGSNSMTRGILSQVGRLIDGRVFDQTTVAAFPGSSGGGVYLTDGRMMGMLLRGSGETFNLIAPVRRISEWAKNAGVEWAVDANVPLPADDELKKLPVEDIGVSFTASAANAPPKAPASVGVLMPGWPFLPEQRKNEEEPFQPLFKLQVK